MNKRKQSLRDQVRARIRAAGLRSTTARLAVLESLHAASTPISHGDLAEKLSPLGFDKATIYRNLVELAEAGILQRVELGDHVWRFELISEDDSESADHPHFICVDCGEVACLPGVSVNVAAQRGKKARIGDVTQVVLKGHCERCV